MLLFGLLVAGGGALLTYAGIVDPPGGLFGELGRVLAGKPLTRPTAAPTAFSPAGGSSTADDGTSNPRGARTRGGDVAHAAKRAAGLARAAAAIGMPCTPGYCLAYASRFYGHSSGSGIHDAAAWWAWAPNKHPGDRNPPAGAAVAWTGGSRGHGHIAIADGLGYVIGTDFPTRGKIGRYPIAKIGGSLRYAGWAEPDFRTAAD